MIAILASLVLVADPVPASADTGPQLLTISGKVTGCSGEHSIYVALNDPRMFQPGAEPIVGIVRRPREVKGGAVEFTFAVPAGAYAISAFEDENDNGELDMGMFGPKEPSQFYRRFTAWRAPRFEDVEFTVDRDVTGAVIALR